MRLRNKIFIACAAVASAAIAVPVVAIGPRNLIGMALYDQREEGSLTPGSPAPDVELISLDGKLETRRLSQGSGRPIVLIFGSFT